MKKISIQHIQKNALMHPMSIDGFFYNAKQYKELVGDYEISIVGGSNGLYGDFQTTFEVAVIDSKSGEFVTESFSKKAYGGVLAHGSIEDVNEVYHNVYSKISDE